jgi:hypothetical protein
MARLTLRLSEPLHAQLAARSRQRGVSINQLVVETLARSLEEEHTAPSEERARLLAALGDLASDGWLVEEPGDEEVPLLTHEELWQLMPTLDPPLSSRIIADREDRL